MSLLCQIASFCIIPLLNINLQKINFPSPSSSSPLLRLGQEANQVLLAPDAKEGWLVINLFLVLVTCF